MTLFSLKELISYRWKAQTRHGVHSPFVYDLVDKMLLNENRDTGNDTMDKIPGWISSEQRVRIAPIMSFYIKDKDNFPDTPSFYFLSAEEENKPLQDLKFTSSSIVFVTDIHTNKESLDNWTDLSNDKYVKLSIDLYHVGILFFRKEFKEKQHFVLKY